jgi:hypothetical protein
MTRILAILGSVLCFGSLCGCNPGRQSTGGGIDVGNGVHATIVHSDGRPAVHARVEMRYKSAIDTGTVRIGYTDQNGRINFEIVDSVAYSLFAHIGDTLGCVLEYPIETYDTLRTTVEISGVVDADSKYQVALPGTGKLINLNEMGSYRIQGVPPDQGTIDFVNSSIVIRSVQLRMGRNKIIYVPKQEFVTGDLPVSNFRDSMSLSIDLSPTGHDLKEDLIGFVVPFALDSLWSGWGHIQEDGDDLRCFAFDGTALRMEMEEWNYLEKRALLWVRLDQLTAGDFNQGVMIRWGNQSVGPRDLNLAVFDTSNGFAGVWHFSRLRPWLNSSMQPLQIMNNGSKLEEGAFGGAIHVDSTGYAFITKNSILERQEFSWSLWVKQDVVQDSLAKILHYGRSNLPFASYALEFQNNHSVATWQISYVDSTWQTMESSLPLEMGQWNYLSVVSNPLSGFIIAHDEEIELFAMPQMIRYDADIQNGLFIGRNGDGYSAYTNIAIDELRFHSVARSAEWLRFEQMGSSIFN